MFRVCRLLTFVVAVVSCRSEAAVDKHVLAAIYADDDRHEVADYPDESWANRARHSVAGMLRLEHWNLCDEAPALREDAPTLEAYFDVCPSVPFASQHIVSSCSSVLVDDDLIALAEHCMPDEGDCEATLFAFGLYNDGNGALRTPSYDEIYQCKRIVARPEPHDVIFVELDRPVSAPYAPAEVAPELPQIDDPLKLVGFPSSVPMKIVDNCSVVNIVGNSIHHNCDAFRGNSGGPIFDEQGRVLGVLSRAPGDYRSEGDCKVPNVLLEDGTIPGVTDIPQWAMSTSVVPAVQALCAGGRASRLCDAAPSCGDGECTGDERYESCAADCAAPSCGDAVCDVRTERKGCADCAHIACGDHGEDAAVMDASVSLDASVAADGSAQAGDASTEMPDAEGAGCSVRSAKMVREASLTLIFASALGFALGRRRRRACAPQNGRRF